LPDFDGSGEFRVKKSGWWKAALKYVLAVALLFYIVASNWTALNNLFRKPPHVEIFLLAAAILITATAIQYVRWYLLVRAVGLPFTLWNAVRLGLVGTFYNTFLPGSVGGDLVKAYFIAQGHPERKAVAVATVVADRLVGLFGLLLFAAAVGGGCWLGGNEKIESNQKLQLIIWVCIGLACSGIVGFVTVGLLPESLAKRLSERLARIPKLGKTISELWFVLRTYSRKPATVFTVIAMSAVVHSGFVLIFHLAVRVFPPADLTFLGSLPEHFVIAPIGYIVQALIPLPGGIGGGEFTFGGLYGMIRPGEYIEIDGELTSGKAVGLAGRLTMRVTEWTIGFIGYIAFLRMKTELKTEVTSDSPEA
jgi:uncharacterized protein (TIRG00374 family)